MKNTLKKLLAIVMVLTMLFAFAACGGNDEGTTTTEAPVTEAPSTETPVDNGSAANVEA